MPAVAAVGAIPEIAIGFVAFIFAWALFSIFRPLIVGLAILPLGIGSWIAARVSSIVWGIWATVSPWVEASIGPISDTFGRLAVVASFFTTWSVDAAEAAWQAAWKIEYVTVPSGVARAFTYAWGVAQGVEQYAVTLFNAAQGYAGDLFRLSTAYAQQLAGEAIAYAEAEAQAVTGYAQSVFNAAIAYDQAEAQALEQWAGAGITDAERYAEQLASGVEGYAIGLVQDAEGYARQLAGEANAYAEQVGASALEQAVARDQVIWAALSQDIGAVDATLNQYLRDCGDPMCENLGGLSQGMSDIQSLLVDGALLAFIAAAVTDPSGTAAATEQLLVDPFDQAANGLLSLVGVKVAA